MKISVNDRGFRLIPRIVPYVLRQCGKILSGKPAKKPGSAVRHQHNGFNGDRSRTAEWIPKQYVVMQTCVDDQRRRKSFTQRGNVCLRAVAALVQRSAGGVYHQCRIVLEYEKFDLIFYSGFRHTHKTVF